MKHILLFVGVFILGIFFNTQSAVAHILESNGSVGAVLHIDPEDDPIAGKPSSLFFEFKDTIQKFTPQNCTCTFSILENGKQIFTEPLFQDNQDPSLTSASVSYTFPQKDVYQIKIVGKPSIPNDFQPFILSYDIRVAREDNSSSNALQQPNWWVSHLPHFLAAGIVIGFIIFGLITKKKEQKKQAGG